MRKSILLFPTILLLLGCTSVKVSKPMLKMIVDATINFCPGWKAFFTHQDEETKTALRKKYNFKKYL